MDRNLFDFAAVTATGVAVEEGDKAFDPQDQFTTFSNPE